MFFDLPPEALLGHQHQGVALVKESGEIVLANSAFFRTFGYEHFDQAQLEFPKSVELIDKSTFHFEPDKEAIQTMCAVIRGRPHDIRIEKKVQGDSSHFLIEVRDAGDRIAALDQVAQLKSQTEKSSSRNQTIAEADVLLRFFLQIADSNMPQQNRVGECIRTLQAIFPNSGALSFQGSSFTVWQSWGDLSHVASFEQLEASEGLSERSIILQQGHRLHFYALHSEISEDLWAPISLAMRYVLNSAT